MFLTKHFSTTIISISKSRFLNTIKKGMVLYHPFFVFMKLFILIMQ